MKTLLLFLLIVGFSFNLQASKPRPAKPIKSWLVKQERRRRAHENHTFQMYLQSNVKYKGRLSRTFAPRNKVFLYPIRKSKFNKVRWL